MRSTRRELLGGLTGSTIGMAVCGCAARGVMAARSGRVGRRAGRTIDVHAHCNFHEALALMGPAGEKIIPQNKGTAGQFIVADERLAAMDAMGIDMQMLSINPFWYGESRERSAHIVTLQNDRLAELCAAHPDRFGAFASLSMQHPDVAVVELERAMKLHGFCGAAIGGDVNGINFSDERFHDVWAKAEELGAVLFIHPQSPPELAKRLSGNGWLSNTIGNPLGTTIALEHLIFEGTLDRFPNLKILAAHGGGYLPSYAPRGDRACFVSPDQCNPAIKLKKHPSEYLRQIYVDTIVFTPEALAHLISQVGASQVLLGSDYPAPWEAHPVELVLATPGLSQDQRMGILGRNAERLFASAPARQA